MLKIAFGMRTNGSMPYQIAFNEQQQLQREAERSPGVLFRPWVEVAPSSEIERLMGQISGNWNE